MNKFKLTTLSFFLTLLMFSESSISGQCYNGEIADEISTKLRTLQSKYNFDIYYNDFKDFEDRKRYYDKFEGYSYQKKERHLCSRFSRAIDEDLSVNDMYEKAEKLASLKRISLNLPEVILHLNCIQGKIFKNVIDRNSVADFKGFMEIFLRKEKENGTPNGRKLLTTSFYRSMNIMQYIQFSIEDISQYRKDLIEDNEHTLKLTRKRIKISEETGIPFHKAGLTEYQIYRSERFKALFGIKHNYVQGSEEEQKHINQKFKYIANEKESIPEKANARIKNLTLMKKYANKFYHNEFIKIATKDCLDTEKWYQSNALEPNEEAWRKKIELGIRYYNGDGVKRSKKNTEIWFSKAQNDFSKNQKKEALLELATLYYNGKVTDKDESKALSLIDKYIKQGAALDRVQVAVIELSINIYEHHIPLSKKLLTLECEKNIIKACDVLDHYEDPDLRFKTWLKNECEINRNNKNFVKICNEHL